MNEKLIKSALKWMNNKFSFNQLEILVQPNYPYTIYYKKDGKFVMEQDNKNMYFWFDYNLIWSVFNDFFQFKCNETELVLKEWLEEVEKLGVFTPNSFSGVHNKLLEEVEKLGVFTPIKRCSSYQHLLEEVEKLGGFTPSPHPRQTGGQLEEVEKLKKYE